MRNYPEMLFRVLGDRHVPRTLRGAVLPHEDGPAGVLLAAADASLRKRVGKYLRECFGEHHYDGYVVEVGLPDQVDCLIAQGEVITAVDVVPVSSYLYEQHLQTVVARAAHTAAAKAHVACLEDATILVLDRNKSNWAAFDVEGDFARAAQALPGLLAGGQPTQLRIRPNVRFTLALDTYLFGLNSKTDPDRPRHPGIHPSEFSTTSCDRRVAYTVIGIDKKESTRPQLRRIFDTGHAFHDVLQGALAEMSPAFRAEVPVHHADLRIVGHCDGVLDEDGFEIKSINENGHRKLRKEKSEHQKQGVLYASLLQLQRVLYLYASKETGELLGYPVSVDRSLWQSMAARATRIVRAVDSGNLPTRIDSEYHCRECPYAWTCRKP